MQTREASLIVATGGLEARGQTIGSAADSTEKENSIERATNRQTNAENAPARER